MKKKRPGTVRIIGGKWRGTRVPVTDLAGLRPSGDRSRETLFNWLQMHLRGSRCIDLFAGSGVLGLEAASRGAAKVTLVEKDRLAAAGIRETARRLNAEQLDVIEADAISWLARVEPKYIDIVFIDPPFGSGLERQALDTLTTHDCIKTGGLVYLETAKGEPVFSFGPEWEISREKLLGEVRMQLLKKV